MPRALNAVLCDRHRHGGDDHHLAGNIGDKVIGGQPSRYKATREFLAFRIRLSSRMRWQRPHRQLSNFHGRIRHPHRRVLTVQLVVADGAVTVAEAGRGQVSFVPALMP